jgi:Rap1a immunity proteins
MRGLLAIFVASCFILLSSSEQALGSNPQQRRYVSDQQLRMVCTPDPASSQAEKLTRVLCQQYVLGVVDGHEAATGVNPTSARVFCLPEGISNAQLTDLVIQELATTDPDSNKSAAFRVFDALQKAFPCEVTK